MLVPKKFILCRKSFHQTNEKVTVSSHANHALAFVCAVLISVSLSAGSFFVTSTDEAWADVRRSDEIVGLTVEQREIGSSLCPSIDAQYALVVDDTGMVYFERDALTATQIASITKIMTAIVSLDIAQEHGLMNLEITVSARAASIGESSAELLEGDMLSVEEALKALMIPSGNDAAMALAENLGKYLLDSEDANEDDALAAFVLAMNDKAAEIGCVDTHFENPHGLDGVGYEGDQHSTAMDVLRISYSAMQNDLFRDIVSTETDDITVMRENQEIVVTLNTTDELLGVYEGACGIKTGYTTLAGSCFAGVCQRADKYLYAIVLDSSSDAQRFTDTQTLFDWVYDNWITYTLANSEESISMSYDGTMREVPVVAEVAHKDWIDKTIKATFADPDAAIEVFSLKGNISQSFEFNEVTGNVKAGDVIGSATFYQDNEVVTTQDVIAAEDMDAPGFFDSIAIWWNRFVGNIFGSIEESESVVLNETPLIYDKHQ